MYNVGVGCQTFFLDFGPLAEEGGLLAAAAGCWKVKEGSLDICMYRSLEEPFFGFLTTLFSSVEPPF